MSMPSVCPRVDSQVGSIHISTLADNNLTALHSASINGYIEVVKFLVECGMDVNTIGVSLGRFPSPLRSHLGHRQQ
jgi:ankyrin repeat protein